MGQKPKKENQPQHLRDVMELVEEEEKKHKEKKEKKKEKETNTHAMGKEHTTKDQEIGAWMMAETMRRTKQHQAARHYYQQACGFGHFAHTNSSFGQFLYKQKEWKNAEKHYRKAIEINPGSKSTHYNLGKMYQQQGRQEEAEKHYQEALRWKPDDPDVHGNLGLLYNEQGKNEKAEKHYLLALVVRPSGWRLFLGLGLVSLRLGKWEQAKENTKKAEKDTQKEHKMSTEEVVVAVGQAKEWKKWLKQAPKTHKEWAKKTTQALEKAEEEKQ